MYKPPLAVEKVDSGKANQNKNLKCEKSRQQGHDTSKCWTKKASKDTFLIKPRLSLTSQTVRIWVRITIIRTLSSMVIKKVDVEKGTKEVELTK